MVKYNLFGKIFSNLFYSYVLRLSPYFILIAFNPIVVTEITSELIEERASVRKRVIIIIKKKLTIIFFFCNFFYKNVSVDLNVVEANGKSSIIL